MSKANRLALVIEGLIAANECNSFESQRVGKLLGFKVFDYFYLVELIQLAEELGFDHTKVHNGIWVNRKGGTPLTPEQIEDELC